MKPEVIVVGAGHNGLVAACYLARAGHRVLVVEATESSGGMTSTSAAFPKAPEYRVNEGAMDASLIRTNTIPYELELERFGWQEIEVDPPYVWLDPDGSSLCVWRDPLRTADELRGFSQKDARAFLELANELHGLLEMVIPYMNSDPLRPSVRAMLGGVARALRHPSRLAKSSRLFLQSHAEVIDENFEHRAIRGLLAALPCFAPITQDGTAWVLVYFGLIHEVGVSRYVGGTGSITDALERCLAHHGGEIRYGACVREILIERQRVRGVGLQDGEELVAPVVVTASNVKTVLTSLLPEGALDDRLLARAERIPTSGTRAGSFKFDLALRDRIALTEHQANRRDAVDLRKPCLTYTTFEEHITAWEACERGDVPSALPMITVIPTAVDPTQAPDGTDTIWSWTGICAANPREPWEELRSRIGKQEVDRARALMPSLSEFELDRRVLTPPDFAARFRVPDGNVYHVDPVATRFGPTRPALGLAAFRSPVNGLVLSGGGMHPSAGICGVPGRLAAQAAHGLLSDTTTRSLRLGGVRKKRETGADASAHPRAVPPRR